MNRRPVSVMPNMQARIARNGADATIGAEKENARRDSAMSHAEAPLASNETDDPRVTVFVAENPIATDQIDIGDLLGTRLRQKDRCLRSM
jgi:hypothetical protein